MPTVTSANVRSPPTGRSTHGCHRHNPAVGMMSVDAFGAQILAHGASGRRLQSIVTTPADFLRLPIPTLQGNLIESSRANWVALRPRRGHSTWLGAPGTRLRWSH